MDEMTNMSSIAAYRNAFGAHLYGQGDIDAALRYFGSALDIMSRALIELRPCSDRFQSGRKRLAFQATPSPHPRNDLSEKVKSRLICDNLFTFEVDDFPSHDTLRLCQGLIEYNIGLVLHARSRYETESTMLTALMFYDLCLCHTAASPQCFACSNVILSALNNKAIICYDLCDFEKATIIASGINKIIENSHDVMPPFTSQSEFQGILLNILLLSFHSSAPAA